MSTFCAYVGVVVPDDERARRLASLQRERQSPSSASKLSSDECRGQTGSRIGNALSAHTRFLCNAIVSDLQDGIDRPLMADQRLPPCRFRRTQETTREPAAEGRREPPVARVISAGTASRPSSGDDPFA